MLAPFTRNESNVDVLVVSAFAPVMLVMGGLEKLVAVDFGATRACWFSS